MTDRYVYPVGKVATIDGPDITAGCDYDAITLDPGGRVTIGEAEKLLHHLADALREARRQRAEMEAEAAVACSCPCDCPAPGRRDDGGMSGWCDSCRMNIHPVTAKTEA